MTRCPDHGPPPEIGPPLVVVLLDDKVFTKVQLVGELDLATAQVLDAFVQQQMSTGHLVIELDLAHLQFCDLAGLRLMLRAQRLLTAAGGELVLRHPAALLVRVALLMGWSAELGLGPDPALQTERRDGLGQGAARMPDSPD